MNEKEENKCQFYIVLGEHDRTFPNDERNRFFTLKGNEDINLIQYALAEEWKKKKKENIKVANEIIFLIPDLEYKDLVKDLMDKLNCRGKFRVIKPLKERIKEKSQKEVKEQLPPKEEPEIKTEIKEEPKKEVEVSKQQEIKEEAKIKVETPKQQEIKERPQRFKAEKVKTIQNKDNVFHGDFDKKGQKEITDDISDYMWGESKKNKLTLSKEKGKIDLPLIIFIFSALFLIGAILLLFVLK